jgi:hypothetical protein
MKKVIPILVLFCVAMLVGSVSALDNREKLQCENACPDGCHPSTTTLRGGYCKIDERVERASGNFNIKEGIWFESKDKEIRINNDNNYLSLKSSEGDISFDGKLGATDRANNNVNVYLYAPKGTVDFKPNKGRNDDKIDDVYVYSFKKGVERHADWYSLTYEYCGDRTCQEEWESISNCPEDCCTDSDGDGYYSESSCPGKQDCNDNNAEVYPDRDEICSNNIDNDCDGNIGCCDSECPCGAGYTCTGCVCVRDPYCGDGVCDSGETIFNCPDDCGSCGNGICDNDENARSCPDDCIVLGDGICSLGKQKIIASTFPLIRPPLSNQIILTELSNVQVTALWEDHLRITDARRATEADFPLPTNVVVPIAPGDCGFCGDGFCGLPPGNTLMTPEFGDRTDAWGQYLENEDTCPDDCAAPPTCDVSVDPLSHSGDEGFSATVTYNFGGSPPPPGKFICCGYEPCERVTSPSDTLTCTYPPTDSGVTYVIEGYAGPDPSAPDVRCRTTLAHYGGSSSGSDFDDEGPTIIFLNGFLTYSDGIPIEEEVDVSVEISATGFSWEHEFTLDISNGMINLPLGDDEHSEFPSGPFSLELLKVYDISVEVVTDSGSSATFEMKYTR